MKIPRIVGYFLMLILIISSISCVKANLNPVAHTVQINADCTITQGSGGTETDAAIGDTVSWDPPNPPTGHTYSVSFAESPFSASTISAGPQGPVVTGTLLCNKLTVGSSFFNSHYCYFPYTLLKENGKKCSDPGVHVVPPN